MGSMVNCSEEVLAVAGAGFATQNPKVILESIWALHSLLTAKIDHSLDPFETDALTSRALHPLLPLLQKVSQFTG
jgi:hypothetical protein